MFPRLPLLSEEDEPDLWLGGAMFVLLDDPEDWVHRRVETVSFLDASSVHRRISVDFDVPREGVRPESGPLLAPLTLLEKRPLVNLDVRDETGAAQAVLNAEENGFVAWSLLARVVQVVLASPHDPEPSIPDHVLQDLKAIAGGSPEAALSVLASITSGPSPDVRQHLALPLFQEYAQWMATKFILLVEVPEGTDVRRVLKISYSQPLERVEGARWQRWTSMAGWRPAQFDVDVEGAGEGQSYHCEFEAPQGLEVGRAELVLSSVDDPHVEVRYQGEVVGRRAHIYAPDAPLGADAIASIWLLPPRAGLVRAALFTSAVIAAVFLFFSVDDRITATRLGRTLPLLLAAPGVVAGFVLRPGEHRIATDLLAGVRAAVAVSALAAYVGALIIAAGVAESTLRIAWKTLGILALACFTSLSVAYCFVSYRSAQEEEDG